MKQTAKDKLFVVYCHTNKLNGKRYFGITSMKPQKRWGKNGVGYKDNEHFWNAIQKYGWDNFDHKIIADNLCVDDACNLEREMVAKFKSNKQDFGYNRTSGGEEGQYPSEETKQKMRESAKNRVITDEWRQHLSESGKGHIPWNKGGHLSEEHKEKLKVVNSGRKHSEQSLLKMSENSTNNVPVEIDGIPFISIRCCADYLGDGRLCKKLQAWLCGENSMPFEYKERGLSYVGVPHEYVEVNSGVEDKIVVCDGIEFASMAACERYYNLPRMSVTRWLSGRTKMPQDFVDKGLCYSTKKRYWYKRIE